MSNQPEQQPLDYAAMTIHELRARFALRALDAEANNKGDDDAE